MTHNYGTIRIALADDHAIFREGFKVLLKNQEILQLVGEAEDGKEMLEVISHQKPDIAIVDIKMPVMDGIATCRQIRKKFPDIKVIALSMFNDDNLIVDMLEAGASGYLLKNTNKAELLQAAKVVHEGGTYFCNATSSRLTKMIGDSKFNPYRNQPAIKFSEREIAVMKLICEQKATKEMAEILGLSIRTVETHRQNVQEKIGAKNMVGVAIYAIKQGIYEP